MWVIYLFNISFFSYAVRISPQNTHWKLMILPKYGALIWAVSGIDGQIRSLGYAEVPNAHNFIYIYNWLINKNDLFLHNFICINWNFYIFLHISGKSKIIWWSCHNVLFNYSLAWLFSVENWKNSVCFYGAMGPINPGERTFQIICLNFLQLFDSE